MMVDNLNLDTVRLLPGSLQMKEMLDMTLFVIRDWTLTLRNESNTGEGVKMKVVLKRKITNELMTTYLPSILLIFVTFATTFFKPFFFEAALSVNLTTMLVLTTIFIGVMQGLPTTAYIKMIDVWLIFAQMIPFTEVMLLTIMELLRDGDGSGEDAIIHISPATHEVAENEPEEIKGNQNVIVKPKTKHPMRALQEQRELLKLVTLIGKWN